MLRALLIGLLLLPFALSLRATAGETALERARRSGDDREKIRILEEALAKDPGRFDAAIHGELLLLYRPRNARKHAEHADRILEHVPMDPTVMAALEGNRGASPVPAANRLIHRGHRWPDLRHLWAACSLRAAELLEGTTRRDDARKLREAVRTSPEPSLAPYRERAR